jgi:hypothetical protein
LTGVDGAGKKEVSAHSNNDNDDDDDEWVVVLKTFSVSLYFYQNIFAEIKTASTKMSVCWVVSPCSLEEVYRRFRVPDCLRHQRLMMEAASASETSANFHQTTRVFCCESVYRNSNIGLKRNVINYTPMQNGRFIQISYSGRKVLNTV